MSLLRCVGGSMQEADSRHTPRGLQCRPILQKMPPGLGLQKPGVWFFKGAGPGEASLGPGWGRGVLASLNVIAVSCTGTFLLLSPA